MLFFKRTRQIQARIQEYLDSAAEVLEAYQRGLDYYVGRGITPHFQALVDEIHAKESQADDLRRDIELELYKRSLLPESREDIFRLLEVIDQIPNKCEDILRQILTQKLDIPADLHGEIRELAQVAGTMMGLIREGVAEVFGDNRQVHNITSRIDQQESVGDRLQQSAIQKLFNIDRVDTADKVLFRDIINEIGSVCDLADDVGISLDILSVKRLA
jgi:predicted phosphate transport protein (TIGR00153 family)